MTDGKVTELKVNYLKGEVKGITIKVRTGFTDGDHVLRYGRSVSTRGNSPIERLSHRHPWGENVRDDAHAYANDIIDARDIAVTELQKRGLLNEDEWRDSQ